MRDWLTQGLLISVLLLTSFTSVGLMALWAAASRRNWFVRTFVVFAVLLPLQIIPAYGIYLAFAVAILATCFNFVAYRFVRQRRANKEPELESKSVARNFSLRTALLVTAALAAALAVATHVPAQVWGYWPAWTISGGILAVAFLTVWCAANPRLPRLLRIILFAIGSVSSGFVCYWAGGGLFGLVRSALPPIAIGPPDLGISWHWFFLGVVTASTLYVGIILSGLLNRVGAGNQIANTLPQNNRTKSCPALFTVFLAAIALLPVTTIWELMHPLPIPDEPHFSPNGIAELVRLGQKLDQSQITKLTSADVIDYDRVAKAVAAQQTDYDEISRVLQIPSWIPVTYDLSYFDNIGDLSARRQIARLLSAKCQVEIRAKRIDDAINTEAAMLNLAEIYYQGGFAVDFLVAVACEGIAQGAIYQSIDQFDRKQCHTMQQIVESVASRRRGIDDVLYREHVFMQRSMGWFSHLAEYITRITIRPSDGWNVDTSVREAYDRTLAIERLLMLKIAIRAYQLDHGRLPSQLTQLVPDYIPALPIDPFDPSGQPPRFQNKGDDYLLYSVGQDGYDDGGQPQSYPIPFDQTIPDGDITLEGQFPPDTADQNQPKSGGDAKAQPETAQSPLPN